MLIKMRFHHCFNVYNFLIDEKLQRNFKQVKICVIISNKFFKLSVNELLKFCHISKINTSCCVVHVTIITLFWFVTYIHIYIYARTHTHIHIHTLTQTPFKFYNFLERSKSKRSRNQIHQQLRQYWSMKFNTRKIQVFWWKPRSKNDSG